MPHAYDVKTGKYVKDGGALTVASSSKDNAYIYAFHGNKSKLFRKYDKTADVWTDLESIPYGYKSSDPTKIDKKTPKKGSALCWDNDNTIYAVKGNTNEFWAYSLDTDTWIQKAYIPVPKKCKGGTSIIYYDSKVYALAGGQKVTDPTNFYIYDPLINTWSNLINAPYTPNNKAWKDGSAITLMDNIIYAIKGGDKYNVFYAYDIATTTWTEKESIPLVHPTLLKKNKTGDGGAITNDGTSIYMIKGKGKQDFWSYLPGTPGVWTPLDTIPRLHKKSVAKTGAALTYSDGAIYFLKGNNTPEFWRYVPTEKSKVNSQISNVGQGFNLATQSKPEGLPYNMHIEVTPNPINRNTQIRYSVPTAGNISIKLYNTTGRLVETFINEYQNSGSYTLNIDNLNIAKGIYFLRYENVDDTKEIKLIVK